MERKAKFVWIEDGSLVDFGDSGLPGISGSHKLVGFKPAPGRRIGGWLVFLTSPREANKPHRIRRVA